MKAEEIAELISMGTEYLEIFRATIPLMKEVVTEVKPFMEKLAEFKVEVTCASFDGYREHGFSREEALLLTINSEHALSTTLDKVQLNKG